jgi:sigma-B regulation protein RsbU (phosphoserine phosphatase)
MAHDADRTLQMLTSLLDGAHLAAPDSVADVIASAGAHLGWSASVYLVDYEQRELIQLSPTADAQAPSERVDGTIAGRAFSIIEPLPATAPDGRPRLWVPLIDGVDRLGVIDIRFEDGTATNTDEVRDAVRWFSHLVGHLIGSKSPYGDTFHTTRLSRPRTVESELIWSMLPPLTMACHGLVISGLLEPAHAVAGDVFDYAVSDDVAHFTIVDATGHDLQSGVIGATALASYRNSRRRGADLPHTARVIDDTLARLADNTYATGVFAQLELTSGVLHYVNAGHPAPFLLRSGKIVKSLEGGRRSLLGLPPHTCEPAAEQLERGDWLILYTDGVTEARDDARQFFGLDRFVDVVERCAASGLNAAEALRRIVHRVMEHQHGVLQDDATIVVVQWAGGDEHCLYSG